MVTDASTPTIMSASKRSVARRGHCTRLYSDQEQILWELHDSCVHVRAWRARVICRKILALTIPLDESTHRGKDSATDGLPEFTEWAGRCDGWCYPPQDQDDHGRRQDGLVLESGAAGWKVYQMRRSDTATGLVDQRLDFGLTGMSGHMAAEHMKNSLLSTNKQIWNVSERKYTLIMDFIVKEEIAEN
ncbi:hypothetical protein LAZ67_11002996 [Cordylochernes scorpioides]|uniref:Uncharacterized protein n=1 Tax=Cordylochernes scorpioides TaxID=51811 RepID=A0ABY6KZL0_9ARAC|nr:hypothetical protein LAZ67_11002996 [Cordylochernes scorpioides]